MTKVINLFAGPGAGKSTTAAGLFYHMKHKDLKCELVTEYAKDLAYEVSKRLDSQVHISGEQAWRMERLLGRVDYIITDSPLVLGSLYAPFDYPQAYHDMLANLYSRYQNHNFFIRRVKPYQIYGRQQTEDEAKLLDARVIDLLRSRKISYAEIKGDFGAPEAIMKALNI